MAMLVFEYQVNQVANGLGLCLICESLVFSDDLPLVVLMGHEHVVELLFEHARTFEVVTLWSRPAVDTRRHVRPPCSSPVHIHADPCWNERESAEGPGRGDDTSEKGRWTLPASPLPNDD